MTTLGEQPLRAEAKLRSRAGDLTAPARRSFPASASSPLPPSGDCIESIADLRTLGAFLSDLHPQTTIGHPTRHKIA